MKVDGKTLNWIISVSESLDNAPIIVVDDKVQNELNDLDSKLVSDYAIVIYDKEHNNLHGKEINNHISSKGYLCVEGKGSEDGIFWYMLYKKFPNKTEERDE